MSDFPYRQSNETAENGAYAVAADVERLFMNRVYNWMAGGLAISGLTAWKTAQTILSDPHSPLASPGVFFILVVAELILVSVLSWAIKKLSPMAAAVCFLVYSVLSGITLAPIFLVYTQSAIFAAFFACAGTFAVTSIYGYVTKRSLAGMGSIAVMGLIGIIIASIVNWFLRSKGLDVILTYLGVAVFVGLTAWDTQRLRSLATGRSEEEVYSGDMKKIAIVGALMLYLDFINLFLMLLKIFGGRRN